MHARLNVRAKSRHALATENATTWESARAIRLETPLDGWDQRATARISLLAEAMATATQMARVNALAILMETIVNSARNIIGARNAICFATQTASRKEIL